MILSDTPRSELAVEQGFGLFANLLPHAALDVTIRSSAAIGFLVEATTACHSIARSQNQAEKCRLQMSTGPGTTKDLKNSIVAVVNYIAS